jgi:predicted PurR-regulated permease PerM
LPIRFRIIVSSADAFLKPLLLGRGVEVPMLVILLGAIGGAISMGILGLFLGAVILALGYEMLSAWLREEGVTTPSEENSPP